MNYSETTPQQLADAVVHLVGTDANWPAIPTDGARRAAELIDELAPEAATDREQAPDEPRRLTTVAPM